MKKHIIAVVAVIAVFVMMFAWTVCGEKIVKEKSFEEMGEIPINEQGYKYYKNLYKFNDDCNGDGISTDEDLNMMYGNVMCIGYGLHKLGEDYLGNYGNCVYRYSITNDNCSKTDYCIKVELNRSKTLGKATIIVDTDERDEDLKSYYTVTTKYMDKETVNAFLKLANSYGIENRNIYEIDYTDGGVFVGIEKYDNGKYYSIIRGTSRDDTWKYISNIEDFFSMLDKNMSEWSFRLKGIIVG